MYQKWGIKLCRTAKERLFNTYLLTTEEVVWFVIGRDTAFPTFQR